ncbi:MAG TPA: amino acid adenylation domain-containing protein, partial [Candidatus Angelobacter sp.]|nr:amino acid adenylation domain-containing protein [Candidatus Angelobacter sp.]
MDSAIEFLNSLASKGIKLSAEAGQLECYAQKGTLTNDIRDGIVKYRSEIIALFENRKKSQATHANGNGLKRAQEFPLSAGQKGLYILHKLHPGLSAYNVPLCLRISSEINKEALGRAWERVLEQFPILTARVIEREDGLYHLLDSRCKTAIQQHAIDFADDQQLLSFLQKRAREPFDLNQGPLTRCELFTQDKRKSVLLVTIHHIVFDGTSAMILVRSLVDFYRQCCAGNPVRLSQDLRGYQEFVAWEETMLASAEGAAHARYWQQQLKGDLPVIELLPELPRPALASFEGKRLVEDLPEELCRSIEKFGKTHSLPPSVIFLAVFQLLLHRYTSQDDIIVGMPVLGRFEQKFAAEVGYFINMVPIRTRCSESMKSSDFLRRIQGTMMDALYHSSYPFPLMLETLELKQAEKNPVFQVAYAYQNFVKPDDFITQMQQQAFYMDVMPVSQEGDFDLALEVFERETSFSLHLKYNPELYRQDTALRFAGHYRTLLAAISEGPDLFLHEYSIIPDQERSQLLTDYNHTQADYPKDKCIHDFFVEQAQRNPSIRAISFGGLELSYQELNNKCCDLAVYLQSLGVKPDSVVGLCMERSPEMMVGIMGAVQAGAAYLPLDPGYPDDRLAYMLQDSRAAVVLAQEKFKKRISALLGPDSTVIALDAQWPEIAQSVADLRAKGIDFRREVKSHNLSYVIYTSGSTGKPKGVLVEHKALVNRIHWMQKSYPLTADDVVLQKTPYSFDVSVWEFFWPMMVGSSLVFAVPDGHKDVQYLENLINQARVTTLHFVPSMLRTFLENADVGCPSVKRIFCSGEALDRKSVDDYKTKFPNAVLHNLYGPTEAAIDVTAYDCSRLNYPFVPIGVPIDNTQIYILDPHNHPQPIGAPGELHIAGDGLARGYLNRPELTEEKFVPNPFHPGTRMYKTGDLARWLDDGNIQYLGRIDTQVKIRGFRIELGEIEACLNQHPGIEDSVVIAQGPEGNKQLAAFYRAKDSQEDHVIQLPNDELRAHLLQSLPDYMAPAVFVSLAAIPLNSNGKVDRRALAGIKAAAGSCREYVAPVSDTEKQLVEIWAEVLKLEPEKIGVNDSFFELGGHSLLATQLISKVRNRLDVELPLKAIFEGNSIAQLSRLITKSGKSAVPAIRPVDRGQFHRLPLSFAQERLWFLHQLEPDSAGYSAPGAVTIRGELDVSQLEEAFNLIIARHENLRTLFPIHEGQAQQLILDRLDFKLERIDLSHYQVTEERDRKVREICRTESARSFDLAQGPLLRGKVITLNEHEHVLMLNMHHIISDGWSLGILIKELGLIVAALRQGRRPELEPLPIQYADYSVWQRSWLEEGGILKQQLAYWQEKLAGVPESLDLATDLPRPSVQSFAGATHEFAVDAQLMGQLKMLAEQQGCTLFMVLLAVWKVLLYRYTGQNDICVGSPIANRQYAETESLIGMFVNTLALRTQVEGGDTFAELLTKVRTTCLEAYEHQDAPFEKVVDLVRPQRNMAISPVFQVMVALQNAAMWGDTGMGSPGQQIQPYPLDHAISKFDLSVDFIEAKQRLDVSLEYCTALYTRRTVERMADHFIALCRVITASPTARICELGYISQAEKQRLLVEYNNTSADYPRDKCIHDFFLEQVRRNPGKTAVVFGEQELSYQELCDKSSDLALYLQCKGVKPDTLVGLCVERSLDMLVGLLGILQAGGAYVPLDPDYPDERLAYMLQDSRAAMVLTQGKLQSKLRELAAGDAELIALDHQWPEISDCVAALKAKDVQLLHQVEPHHLAYVIYTSGSTGRPRGVMVEHGSVVNHNMFAKEKYRITSRDIQVQFSSISFDLFVEEVFVVLNNGAQLVIEQKDKLLNLDYLKRLIERRKITTLNLPTAFFHELVASRMDLSGVKNIIVGGEELAYLRARTLMDKFPEINFHNTYGPTETTIISAAVQITQDLLDEQRTIPIGSPIANTQIYILDQHNNVQPIGVPGELHIAGDGLARGYLNRPELTEEKFVANPFHPGTRMYKTGDLARWLEDGNIQYLGRIDTQVKIRGFRIELGEIEACLNQHPGIEDSVVIAHGQEAEKQLIAFYRAKEMPNEELRAHLLRSLPDYMVPAGFVSLAAIPLNPNGKVDRRALAQLEVKIASGREYVGPGSETEKQLVEIWAEVLKLEPEKIGVNDSFFELGGHSLLATQLIAKVRGRMGIELPLKALFEQTSIAQLARCIAQAEKSKVPPIRAVDRKQIERLPLSFAQERLWFIDQLEPNSAGYNLPGAVVLHGELDVSQLEEALNLIIARHENLRTVFPSQEGQAQQLILERLDFKLERIDLSQDESREAREGKAREICQREAATSFDLARGPLLRGKVIKLDEHEHILMLNMHHIISDGWSLGILIRELGLITEALKQGRRPELEPLPIQYADYSVWQRSWLEEGGILKQQLAYWQEKLAGVAESLDMATDYPRPSVQSFAGATREFMLDAELTEQLKMVAERQGGTLFMVLLAALKALLYRYTGQEDICVGSPIANRQYGETEGLIGMFVNTLALRSQVSGADRFADL